MCIALFVRLDTFLLTLMVTVVEFAHLVCQGVLMLVQQPPNPLTFIVPLVIPDIT
jgi:hypothetical protein